MLLNINSRCLWFEILDLETALVLILSLLRPEDMMQLERTDHHECHEDIGNDEKHCHHAADDLDRLAGESFPDGKGGGDECGVGEDEGVPGHGECESVVSYDGEMGEYGDEEEENCKARLFC